jgi:hypothetical protein
MKNLSYEEKIQRDILKEVKRNRIPRNDNKIIPIFSICGKCKKNKVTSHHFLCDSCWKKKNNGKHNN